MILLSAVGVAFFVVAFFTAVFCSDPTTNWVKHLHFAPSANISNQKFPTTTGHARRVLKRLIRCVQHALNCNCHYNWLKAGWELHLFSQIKNTNSTLLCRLPLINCKLNEFLGTKLYLAPLHSKADCCQFCGKMGLKRGLPLVAVAGWFMRLLQREGKMGNCFAHTFQAFDRSSPAENG